MAGSFLFSGDDVRKPISVLSGGERARLCLAGLLLRKQPVLLLDEPTNHLDFETVEILAEALREYAGTMLFTCHDRTFVKLVATCIVEVKSGAVTLYPSDYETYVYRMEKEVEADAAESDSERNSERGTKRLQRGESGLEAGSIHGRHMTRFLSRYRLRTKSCGSRSRMRSRLASRSRRF